MHASEAALMERAAHQDRELAVPTVPPGSTHEARALPMIDQARDEELAARGQTMQKRTAAATRYWRRHVLG
jgi:hypothetical protein